VKNAVPSLNEQAFKGAALREHVSWPKDMTNKIVQIYVFLEDEDVDVWRPVEAELLPSGAYRIISENADPDIDTWQFTTGQIVKCVTKTFEGGSKGLVAVQEASAS